MDPLSDLRVQLWPNLQKGYIGACERCFCLFVWNENPSRELCDVCREDAASLAAQDVPSHDARPHRP